MPRANRHYIPGYIWHITHRCHKKEFLLKFDKDRWLWLQWLFEAKKRLGPIGVTFSILDKHTHICRRYVKGREVTLNDPME